MDFEITKGPDMRIITIGIGIYLGPDIYEDHNYRYRYIPRS